MQWTGNSSLMILKSNLKQKIYLKMQASDACIFKYIKLAMNTTYAQFPFPNALEISLFN